MPALNPMLVPGFIYLLCAGWAWSQATAHRKQAAEYRKQTTAYRVKEAALEARERALSEDQARLAAEARSPRAIPVRVYELTHQMLEHAVHAELTDVALFSLTESPDTCQMVVDQCIAVADCILNSESNDVWPPTEEDIRRVAAATISGLEASGEQIARTGSPAGAGAEASTPTLPASSRRASPPRASSLRRKRSCSQSGLPPLCWSPSGRSLPGRTTCGSSGNWKTTTA